MERCPKCPGVNNVVPGSGPLDARIVCIGEAPGPDENKRGRCFIGKTGVELDEQYLPLAGLSRGEVYVTNACKCLPPGNGKMDLTKTDHREMVQSCMEFHLYKELEQVRPEVIVLMGKVAGMLVDDVDLELQHGRPVQTRIEVPGFLTYHPALGLHSTNEILTLRNDFRALKKYLRGELVVAEDEYPNPHYEELVTGSEVRNKMGSRFTPIAVDTEVINWKDFFCATFSTAPGEGYLVRSSGAVAAFAEEIKRRLAWVWIHNCMFDLDILDGVGADVPLQYLRDSMIESYHFANVDQGLKAISYRHLGMRMQSFDDLVRPYSTVKMIDYLSMCSDYSWPKPAATMVDDGKGGEKKYQAQGMNTKLKRFFTDFVKNPALDVWERWNNWGVDDRGRIEELFGPHPRMSIADVPFEEALFYACRDADATIRWAAKLDKAARKIRRRPEHEWFDSTEVYVS